jgi:predicted anti-sigma-YlaC factor YlaD
MFCWFLKLLISHNLDTKTKNSRFVEKHIASCKSCCQFYSYAKNIEDKLIKDAKILQAEISQNNIDITKFKQALDTVPHTTKMKSALVAAAACIAIAVIFSAVVNIQKADEAKRTQQAKSQETLKFALSTHSLVTDSIVTSDSTARLVEVMSTPYRNEIETIKSGTRTALRFLVSCVDVNIDDNQKKTITN